MWIKNSNIQVVITFFENITTHQIHLDLKQKVGSIQNFELLLLDKQKVEIRAPKLSCVNGHQIDIQVQALDNNDIWPLHTRAKVLQTEESEENFLEVILEPHNTQDVDFQRFIELFTKRQEQVLRLFEAIKGQI